MTDKTVENPAQPTVSDELVRSQRLPRSVNVPLRRQFSLEELLKGITPENRHGEVDFGRPVGREFPNEES